MPKIDPTSPGGDNTPKRILPDSPAQKPLQPVTHTTKLFGIKGWSDKDKKHFNAVLCQGLNSQMQHQVQRMHAEAKRREQEERESQGG